MYLNTQTASIDKRSYKSEFDVSKINQIERWSQGWRGGGVLRLQFRVSFILLSLLACWEGGGGDNQKKTNFSSTATH